MLLLLVLASVAYAYLAPFRLFTFVVAGRSPVCPLPEALKADQNLRRQVEYKDQILNASKLIDQDPKGYELWDTPVPRELIIGCNAAPARKPISPSDRMSCISSKRPAN